MKINLFFQSKSVIQVFLSPSAEKWRSRELNPNLTGPREESSESKSAVQTIGDGGASWLRRAFKRAEEQAQRSFTFLFSR